MTIRILELQVFVQYRDPQSHSLRVVTGTVMVTKNPCFHTGDIRILQASAPLCRVGCQCCDAQRWLTRICQAKGHIVLSQFVSQQHERRRWTAPSCGTWRTWLSSPVRARARCPAWWGAQLGWSSLHGCRRSRLLTGRWWLVLRCCCCQTCNTRLNQWSIIPKLPVADGGVGP